jgi:hypothetical protein
MKKFKPHMMYDPKTGKGYKAEKPEDHERMAKMGYTHDKPKEGKGFQPAMMLNPKTRAEILAKRKKKMDEDTTTADAGIPQDTKNMGPRLKTTVMHDKRRRKDKQPVLLKKFRKYIEDKGIV